MQILVLCYDVKCNAEVVLDWLQIELRPGRSHKFRIIAVNRVGESEPSPPSKPCTAKGAPPDHNPDGVEVEPVDSTTIQITWNVSTSIICMPKCI